MAFYVAICQGKLPVKSWFALGRTLVEQGNSAMLLSANGTMFEYLMPQLVMPSYAKTLLDHACLAAVSQQIKHAGQHELPWGISESAYSTTDEELNYQYKVFGVPELSLKHKHSADDRVIAPYASAMALMIKPEEACRNLEQLASQRVKGRHGLYESVDHTPSRMSLKHPYTVVRSFMAHHQGMSMLAFAHKLLDKPMQKRFLDDAELASSLQLLQEQIPKDAALNMPVTHAKRSKAPVAAEGTPQLHTPASRASGIQLLSNGKYQVLLTSDGGSFSHWEDIAINKWHGIEKSHGGVFCSVRDVAERKSWSTTYEPLRKNAANYSAYFGAGNAEFHCNRKDFECVTRVVTLPCENIELREVTIRNNTPGRKIVEVTSYTEALMASATEGPAEKRCRPEVDCDRNAILYGRPAKDTHDRQPWMFLNMTMDGKHATAVFYETSEEEALLAIKYKLAIDAGEMVTVKICVGIEENKDLCRELLDREAYR
jgi:hypothetical protein